MTRMRSLLLYGAGKNLFMTRMRSLLLYGINTQNAICTTYIYANTDLAYFSYTETLACMHGLHDSAIRFTLMDAIFI